MSLSERGIIMKIAEIIKTKRESLHESQTDFGNRFGVSATAVSLWESEQREAPYKVITFALTDLSYRVKCSTCNGTGYLTKERINL